MCRLFGFRSVVKSQVHSSLVEADNALLHQSSMHPDGWGVAYYQEDAPHMIKSVESAGSDQLFRRLSGIVTSETVLAHLRKATTGRLSTINTHPFQYGRWVFAHNGNIKHFDRFQDKLKKLVKPSLARFVLGESDSELIFYVIMTMLAKRIRLSEVDVDIELLADAAAEALEEIQNIVGPFMQEVKAPTETYLTFVITNGHSMLGHQGGQNLLYSTYKTLCSDRNSCPSFAPECEAPTESAKVNHLVLSSESLEGANVFIPLSPGEMIGVDSNMTLWKRPPNL